MPRSTRIGALRRLARRQDFQHSPIHALWKRFYWRVRWRLSGRPWVLAMAEKLSIAVSRSGAAALIYYQGCSEPATNLFLRRYLRPGMVFVDVGAHLGEYTLLAARLVGPAGEAHAFEPNPELGALLRESARLNGLRNVCIEQAAASDRDGEAEFEVNQESTLSRLRPPIHPRGSGESSPAKVRCMKLDSWWSRSWKRIDLIKIDVEGAEPLVLLGARELLALPPEQAPVLIIEDGSARWPHFGHAPSMVGSLLTKYGYSIYVYRPRCGLVPATLPLSAVDPFAFDGNLLAAKRKLALVDM